KRIKGDLTKNEERYFQDWINRSEENKLLFQRLETMGPDAIDMDQIAELDVMAAWKKISDRSGLIKNKTSSNFPMRSLLRYAAVLILFFGLLVGYWKYDQPVHVPENMENAITLKLENGE